MGNEESSLPDLRLEHRGFQGIVETGLPPGSTHVASRHEANLGWPRASVAQPRPPAPPALWPCLVTIREAESSAYGSDP